MPQFLDPCRKRVFLGAYLIMLSFLSVEMVPSDEYDDIETSMQIADSLVRCRSIEMVGFNFTSVRENQANKSSDKKIPMDTHSVTAHVPLVQGLEKGLGRESGAPEDIDIDIEDIGAHYQDSDSPLTEPTPLDLWGRSAVHVTTLCAQEWCEMKLDFSLRYLVGFNPAWTSSSSGVCLSDPQALQIGHSTFISTDTNI
jgi:hypothetical protein